LSGILPAGVEGLPAIKACGGFTMAQDRTRSSCFEMPAAAIDLGKAEKRGVALHLPDLGGDISSNGLSKLLLIIAAAFAEAERDRIRE